MTSKNTSIPLDFNEFSFSKYVSPGSKETSFILGFDKFEIPKIFIHRTTIITDNVISSWGVLRGLPKITKEEVLVFILLNKPKWD